MTKDRSFRFQTGSVFTLALCGLLAGCSAGSTGGGGGGTQPGSSGGTSTGSSSGGSSGGSSGTSAFVGDWATVTSTGTITCNGKSETVGSSQSDLTWKESTNADQIYTVQQVAGTSCNIEASVNGEVATGAPGQSCTLSQSASCGALTLTLTLSTYTFAITSPNMAHESFSYAAQGNCGGVAVTCTVAGSSDLQKL